MQTPARKIDPVLGLAIILAFAFCLHGIGWGRVEDWNADQMALRGMSPLLKPHGFLKPPFHTFVNHILVLWPVQWLELAVKAITDRTQNYDRFAFIASHLMVIAMFLGTVVLGYKIADKFYGRTASRIIAFVLAVSAGFLVDAHFLTADIPVTFWMLVAMFFASRIILEPTTKNYIAAGIFTGIATATKYNGLAVGLAIPVAHLLSQPLSWRALLPDRRLILGLAMVVAGFLLGNPWAIFEWSKFRADFMYNYTVAPRYGGETGLGYGKFLEAICQILGLPGAILIGVLAIWSALLLVRRNRDTRATQCFLLFASVFLLYALKIGAFPRVPTRFVLPSVPLLILMVGPGLQVRAMTKWIAVLFAPILLYDCVCSYYVGKRFRDDSRSAAQLWMEANVPSGSRIESSSGAPKWARLERMNAAEISADDPKWSKVHPGQTVDLRMPRANSRFALFSQVFEGNDEIVEAARERERPPDASQFTLEKLAARNPDYVAFYSADYAARIPTIRKYYDDLLAERFPYKIVFDASTPPFPRWIYPREIDHLAGRITVLARKPGETAR